MLYLIGFVLFSCVQSNKQRVIQVVESMMGRTIVMPQDMYLYTQAKDSVMCLNTSKEHIFVYFSSDYCPECNVWKIQEWRDFESQLDEIQIVYIISSKKEAVHDIKEELDMIETSNLLIYIDLNNHFTEKNSFIYSNPVCHVFWTDSDNRIKLVGDPFYSPQMHDMYMNYYDSLARRLEREKQRRVGGER